MTENSSPQPAPGRFWVEYDNDTGPDDGRLVEWWSVIDEQSGSTLCKCDTQADADRIADTLNGAKVPAPEGGQAAEIQPLPQTEFDALMDHIYEHGTMAEGITARARAMCQTYARAAIRAALAAQPQAPLSERAILDLVPSNMPLSNDFELLWFARAIERAHGIQTKEPTNG